jgi:hypothetical protein
MASESSPTSDQATAASDITAVGEPGPVVNAVGEGDPILDPIPEDPRPSELALTIKELAQFPKSEPFPATTDPRLVRWARINYLGELPDGSHRMYTPDLNGTL